MAVFESDQWYTLVPGSILIVIPLLVFVYEAWRRGTERKCKVEQAGNVLLPTPHSLLPSWFGAISGHTLRLDKNRVSVNQMKVECVLLGLFFLQLFLRYFFPSTLYSTQAWRGSMLFKERFTCVLLPFARINLFSVSNTIEIR